MSCNAKKEPNGTWRIQYRWTDWTGTKKNPRKEDSVPRRKQKNGIPTSLRSSQQK